MLVEPDILDDGGFRSSQCSWRREVVGDLVIADADERVSQGDYLACITAGNWSTFCSLETTLSGQHLLYTKGMVTNDKATHRPYWKVQIIGFCSSFNKPSIRKG
ncbi:unnamed protein product [Linum tenue]|uniref:Uncharacterized protein n=1 Tax=Linum tenue TaxID=586396 RepID=A0AAV0NLU5_9ROSI|nr:unnamed protein product [Linum tenue]